ncbi:DUF5999 family protein [Nonomuraea sp. CA-143628]|uniref:DUF5999 family protein n=1 Tax=Nonomuraea sp. CA-143628 TaxID=3239997 RepID=UPI003D8C9BB8
MWPKYPAESEDRGCEPCTSISPPSPPPLVPDREAKSFVTYCLEQGWGLRRKGMVHMSDTGSRPGSRTTVQPTRGGSPHGGSRTSSARCPRHAT